MADSLYHIGTYQNVGIPRSDVNRHIVRNLMRALLCSITSTWALNAGMRRPVESVGNTMYINFDNPRDFKEK